MGTLLIDSEELPVSKLDGWLEELEPVSKAPVLIKNPMVRERKVSSTMIVCGNCAGDEILPRKTFLTAEGCCDHCGGRSFVLASTLFRRTYDRIAKIRES